MNSLTLLAGELRLAIESHSEWLADFGETDFPFLSFEASVSVDSEQVCLTLPTDGGLREFALERVEQKEDEIEIVSNAGPVRLIKRFGTEALKEGVETARLNEVNILARKISTQFPMFRIQRAEINEEHGRFAEIIVRTLSFDIALLGDITGIVSPETLLSRAIVWLRKLQARKINRVRKAVIAADRGTGIRLSRMLSCLAPAMRASIEIWEINANPTEGDRDRQDLLKPLETPSKSSVLRRRCGPLKDLTNLPETRFSKRMIGCGDGEIDRLFSAKGESIRYRGLPFARTRIIKGEENVWFGIEPKRILLEDCNRQEFDRLIVDLEEYRRHDGPFRQHEYFRASPEAWLESILRRDIRQIDANLILSPIYNQFRAAREKIDLLALRNDGRLVIIELKISPDRDMVFQALDYWTKIENRRRRGVLEKGNLFGERKIADRPAMIYLVAPTIGFHSETDYLASQVDREATIVRFDLAENWREQITVINRRLLNPPS